MSKIYDALKKLEASRNGGAANGSGNGNGHARRRWPWSRQAEAAARVPLSVPSQLGPEVEEAYQRLGTNLLVAAPADAGPPPRVLGMTAARHGEGTTTTVAVFGSILARRRGGRVVVIEANFRSPSFDTAFRIQRNGGLAELVVGEKTLADVAQPCEAAPGLFAIGCGHTTLAPPALFDSPGLAGVLDQLRAEFEFVLVDLPPVNVYSDASILGPRLDAALVVIEADATRISEVDRARRNLERVGVRLAGSILNRRRSYVPALLEELL